MLPGDVIKQELDTPMEITVQIKWVYLQVFLSRYTDTTLVIFM